MEPIEPFIYNKDFQVVICPLCQIALFPYEVERHLKDHHQTPPARRRQVRQAVQSIPQIIRDPQQWALSIAPAKGR